MKIYDCIVVGAGIYGSTVAYFLSKNKIDTLLIEKHIPGATGASRYSGGIVRLFDLDAALLNFNYSGREDFIHWDKHNYPGKSPYYKTGLTYLLPENQKEAAYKSIADWGQNHTARLLDRNEFAKKFPHLLNHTASCLLHEETSGYADVRTTINNFVEGFKHEGGTLIENCEIISVDESRGWKVESNAGCFFANSVIFATGAYSKKLFPTLNLKVKSIPLTLMEEAETRFTMPVIDGLNNTYIRPLNSHQFYCGSQHIQIGDHPKHIKEYSTEERNDTLLRIKKLSGKDFSQSILNGFNGLDAYTENNRFIIGFNKELKGIYHLTGFSGRGFKCVISISKTVANEIADYLNKAVSYQEDKLNLSI